MTDTQHLMTDSVCLRCSVCDELWSSLHESCGLLYDDGRRTYARPVPEADTRESWLAGTGLVPEGASAICSLREREETDGR